MPIYNVSDVAAYGWNRLALVLMLGDFIEALLFVYVCLVIHEDDDEVEKEITRAVVASRWSR